MAPMQSSLVYFPEPGPVVSAGRVLPGGRDVTLRTEDGLELGAWLFPPVAGQGRPEDRRTAVLFAPGNGGHREGRVTLFVALASRGFTVLGLDYRGYAGNPGWPSEDGLAADARAGAALLRAEGFTPERTIYLGESLGTGVVARLATTHLPAALALRSPFTCLVDVAKHLYGWLPVEALLRDRFEEVEQLRRLPVPITVIRGSADSIVPNHLSARVAAAVTNLFEDLELPGVDHNDMVMVGPVVADAVVRLAESAVPAI
ncbi:MAG TPA: alpha/beta hydrolase [Dermatophilaceae bacterium]|nr:alpha/beta hydrolase [Dermatophilaceae bacterium]